MARLVYACRFEVPGVATWEDTVVPAYESWARDRYIRAHGADVSIDIAGGTVAGELPQGHVLLVEKFEANEVATRIHWAFPGDQELIWTNTVRIARLAQCCVVEHQVQLRSADYLVAPASFSLGAPGVVRRICEQHPINVGEMRLRATVYPLAQEGIDDFVELLKSPLRRLPVVLTTPFANGEPGEIDALALAYKLAGVAIVAEADGVQATRALSDQIGRLGCYDGGARIYWPGFQLHDDVRLHPLIFGARIATLGAANAARSIERSIFSVAAFRFIPDTRIDAIIAAAEAARRVERVAIAREEGDATWETYALEIAAELEGLKAELTDARAENANLRDNQKVLFSFSDEDGKEDPAADVVREPASVAEAVEFAAADFSNLLFLDSSFEAAKKSPFVRPGEVYEALGVMDKVASVWNRNKGGGDLRQMLIEGGLGRRVSNFISQTAKGKWEDDYTFTYLGKRQVFASHITLGAGAADTCASIHFLPDATAGKLVIGHVGRHLTNTRS
ncbi:hypothetical protein [Xanthobacter versatilis]|uniref:hypothetical protein n=1 Tax=Xanthobacter autotrophicus (strain ATCC BAA-1158 / Py2) TaxID=78245 RepID=UPI003726286A